VLLREYTTLHQPGADLSGLLFGHWAALCGATRSEGGATERPAPVATQSGPVASNEEEEQL
jgi:hypothetical protein